MKNIMIYVAHIASIMFLYIVILFAMDASAKPNVYADEETLIEYNHFVNLLSEFEEGTDGYEETKEFINANFKQVEHNDRIEITMSDSLRTWLNGTGPFPGDED